MNIQPISISNDYTNNRNKPSFKNLIVEYPETYSSDTLNKIVHNKEIQILTKVLNDEDKDLEVRCNGYQQIHLWASPKHPDSQRSMPEYMTYFDLSKLKRMRAKIVLENYRKNKALELEDKQKLEDAKDFVKKFNQYLENN